MKILRGGILECFASLFGTNVKLYIYPAWKKDTNELFTLKHFEDESSGESEEFIPISGGQ